MWWNLSCARYGTTFMWWKRFLAYWHLSDAAVCELSVGGKDYHDYHDDVDGYPWHMADLRCKRCGKVFSI